MLFFSRKAFIYREEKTIMTLSNKSIAKQCKHSFLIPHSSFLIERTVGAFR